MKLTLVIYGVVLAGLLAWVFMQAKSIAKLEATLALIKPAVNPAGQTTDSSTPATSVNAGDVWDSLKKNVADMKIDLNFNKQ